MSSDSFQKRLKKIAKGNFSRLGRLAGISQASVSRLKHGQLPRLDALLSIARAAGVSVHWLATGEGKPRDYPISDTGGIDEGCLKRCMESIDQYQKTFELHLERGAYIKAVCLIYRIVKSLHQSSDTPSEEISKKIFSILQEKT